MEQLQVRNVHDREQVLNAAARYLKLPPQALQNYSVDEWPGHLVVRPPAVFG